MAFEELKEHTENIQEQAQTFVESNIAYYKLKGFKLAMKSTTMIVKFVLIFIFFLMVLLFCSIAGAFAIGHYLKNNALGFLIVGGVYLLLSGLIFLVKDKIIEGPILEKFSKIFFND
jgi:drug/metabolite transporter superfamily protein YnfA